MAFSNLIQNAGNLYYDQTTGRLGIGNQSPSSELHVQSASAGNTTVNLGNARANDAVFLRCNANPQTGDGTTLGAFAAYSSLTGSPTQVGLFQFAKEGAGTDNKTYGIWYTHDGTSFAERMRVTSTGRVGINIVPSVAQLETLAGTTNATTYKVQSNTGGANSLNEMQKTTGVSTTATAILTSIKFGSLCLVNGSDGTNRFTDLVLFGLGTGTVNVISSLNVNGAPAARTYSQSAGTYKLAMASGTYTIEVAALSIGV